VSVHEDDVLGKAYDAQLMRRLIAYLNPYRAQVAVAFVAITVGAVVALAQPYLIKVTIDEYIAKRRLDGLNTVAALYVVLLSTVSIPWPPSTSCCSSSASRPNTSRPGRCS
jgi:ABC-type bacteriocin/lantibiotic exporter with double-glycine peptidase domain